MALGKKTGGRKAGTPNALPATLKEMILQALDDAGGVQYLVEQARKNPQGFMQLLGRVLPLQVKVGGGLTLEQLVAGETKGGGQ